MILTKQTVETTYAQKALHFNPICESENWSQCGLKIQDKIFISISSFGSHLSLLSLTSSSLLMDSLFLNRAEEPAFKLVEEVDKPGEIETDLVLKNVAPDIVTQGTGVNDIKDSI